MEADEQREKEGSPDGPPGGPRAVQGRPAIFIRPPSYHPGYGDDNEGPPQFIIISPMHIVELHKKKRTLAVRLAQKFREISEKWFSHILLLSILLAYAMLGALLFYLLEAPHEHRSKIPIVQMREKIIADLYVIQRDELWRHIKLRMREFEMQVKEAFNEGMLNEADKRQWTFLGSLFFCGTVLTTIGYGNIAPTTTAGRAVFMLYAIIGIPLLLMVLADLGKLFTRAIKFVFFYIRLFYHTGRCRRARRMGRRATVVPVEYMALALRNMPNPSLLRRKSASHDITPDNPDKAENGIKDKENKYAKLPEEDLESKRPDYDIDDEFNLPVSVAMILLVAYMMLGALIFTLWEEWSFFEAFYFVFVSMSTIGFGDYVPDHPMYMMATFIYLLFGLALTSMCINVVQEKLSEIFEIAKMRIGTTVGFDLRNVNVEDYGEDAGSKGQSRRGSKSKPNEEKPKEKSKSPPQNQASQSKNSKLEDIDEIQLDTSPDLEKGKT